MDGLGSETEMTQDSSVLKRLRQPEGGSKTAVVGKPVGAFECTVVGTGDVKGDSVGE